MLGTWKQIQAEAGLECPASQVARIGVTNELGRFGVPFFRRLQVVEMGAVSQNSSYTTNMFLLHVHLGAACCIPQNA